MTWQFIGGTVVGVSAETASGIPKVFVRERNYPNPFNPEVKTRFGIPKDAAVD